MKRWSKASGLALVAFLAAACGGGGGGDSPAPAPGAQSPPPTAPGAAPAPTTPAATANKAEGAYEGRLSTGRDFQAVVLDNDDFWGMYGRLEGAGANQVFLVAGFVQGTGTSLNGSYSSATLRDFGVSPVPTGVLSASYVPGASISGSISFGSAVTLTGSAISPSRFDFNAPARVADITGDWPGVVLGTAAPAFITVAGSGAITGNSSGCQFSGSVAPRGTKNVFAVTVTFGGAPCLAPGQTFTGIGISNLINGGPRRQLIAAVLNGARTAGFAVFSSR